MRVLVSDHADSLLEEWEVPRNRVCRWRGGGVRCGGQYDEEV